MQFVCLSLPKDRVGLKSKELRRELPDAKRADAVLATGHAQRSLT